MSLNDSGFQTVVGRNGNRRQEREKRRILLVPWLKKEQELKNKFAQLKKEQTKLGDWYEDRFCYYDCGECSLSGRDECPYQARLDKELSVRSDKLEKQKKEIQALLNNHYAQKPT